jgi:hypothetical protein
MRRRGEAGVSGAAGEVVAGVQARADNPQPGPLLIPAERGARAVTEHMQKMRHGHLQSGGRVFCTCVLGRVGSNLPHDPRDAGIDWPPRGRQFRKEPVDFHDAVTSSRNECTFVLRVKTEGADGFTHTVAEHGRGGTAGFGGKQHDPAVGDYPVSHTGRREYAAGGDLAVLGRFEDERSVEAKSHGSDRRFVHPDVELWADVAGMPSSDPQHGSAVIAHL